MRINNSNLLVTGFMWKKMSMVNEKAFDYLRSLLLGSLWFDKVNIVVLEKGASKTDMTNTFRSFEELER